MSAGKAARLARIGTGGRYLVVPMDHGITLGAVTGLKDIESTIDAITRGGVDSVLTQKGIAPRVQDNNNDALDIVLEFATVLRKPCFGHLVEQQRNTYLQVLGTGDRAILA